MFTLRSEQHRDIVGSANGVPYAVHFDADGFVEVEREDVARQLVEVVKACVYVDEDGAEFNQIPVTPIAEEKKVQKKQKKNASIEAESESVLEGNEP